MDYGNHRGNYTELWDGHGYQDSYDRNMREWREYREREYNDFSSAALYSRDNPMCGPGPARSRSAHSQYSRPVGRYRHHSHNYGPGGYLYLLHIHRGKMIMIF